MLKMSDETRDFLVTFNSEMIRFFGACLAIAAIGLCAGAFCFA